MQEKRYFTLEEANRCIPELVDEISLLRAIRAQLAGLHAELTPLLEVVSSNGGSKRTPALLNATERFQGNSGTDCGTRVSSERARPRISRFPTPPRRQGGLPLLADG